MGQVTVRHELKEADAFLRAILENPQSDTARLIFADWLEENGCGERAEFIRVQCGIAESMAGGHTADPWFADDVKDCPAQFTPGGCGDCGRLIDLRRRERELLDARGYGWCDGLAGPGRKTRGDGKRPPEVRARYGESGRFALTFRRGFVESVTLTCADFMEHAEALFRAAPITEARLSDMEPGDFTGHPDSSPPLPFTWWSFERRHQHAGVGDLWDFLSGRIDPRHRHAKDYITRDDALADLSRACVMYGRDKAGLPPLEPKS